MHSPWIPVHVSVHQTSWPWQLCCCYAEYGFGTTLYGSCGFTSQNGTEAVTQADVPVANNMVAALANTALDYPGSCGRCGMKLPSFVQPAMCPWCGLPVQVLSSTLACPQHMLHSLLFPLFPCILQLGLAAVVDCCQEGPCNAAGAMRLGVKMAWSLQTTLALPATLPQLQSCRPLLRAMCPRKICLL